MVTTERHYSRQRSRRHDITCDNDYDGTTSLEAALNAALRLFPTQSKGLVEIRGRSRTATLEWRMHDFAPRTHGMLAHVSTAAISRRLALLL